VAAGDSPAQPSANSAISADQFTQFL